MKKRKKRKEITKGIELPNQETIRDVGGKENYKYVRIFGVDTINQTEIREKKIRVLQKSKKTS